MGRKKSKPATKVRLLKGFILVNQLRQLTESREEITEYYLKCPGFWHDPSTAFVKFGLPDEVYPINFHFFEPFSVIHDDKFLRRVERQQLFMEIWGNVTIQENTGSLKFLGVVKLSLHQFFIAYKDDVITNHLWKVKLPVISVDGWLPLDNGKPPKYEVKCLMAMGSDEQISILKKSRLINVKVLNRTKEIVGTFTKLLTELQPNRVADNNNIKCIQGNLNKKMPINENKAVPEDEIPDYFTIQLVIRDYIETHTRHPAPAPTPTPTATATATAKKNGKKKNAKDAIKKPYIYVTFHGQSVLSLNMRNHKSKCGYAFCTKIIEKTNHPIWQETFEVQIDIKYLIDIQFMLQIWQKNVSPKCKSTSDMQPALHQDELIGFALPAIHGYKSDRNIHTYSEVKDRIGITVGMLNASCRAVETCGELELRVKNITRSNVNGNMQPPAAVSKNVEKNVPEVPIVIPRNMEHLQLDEALKEKMCELQEISLRLRNRLSEVTGELEDKTIHCVMDDGEMQDHDEDLNDFEHDIKLLLIEESMNLPF